MTLDMNVAAAGRTEAARHLIDQAQADLVDLVTVSALELCVPGGPRHPLFEEAVARVDAAGKPAAREGHRVGDRGHDRAGLLVEDGPLPPGFIVVTEVTGQNLRAPRFFALGDQAEPVRGIVAELPAVLPADVAGNFRTSSVMLDLISRSSP